MELIEKIDEYLKNEIDGNTGFEKIVINVDAKSYIEAENEAKKVIKSLNLNGLKYKNIESKYSRNKKWDVTFNEVEINMDEKDALKKLNRKWIYVYR